MSTPLGIIHGAFGRVVLLQLNHSMVRHAHRDCHAIFKVGGPNLRFGVKQDEYALTDESMMLINAWEPHFYQHRLQKESITLLTFYFNPAWLKEIDRRYILSGHPRFFRSPVYPLSERLKLLRDDTVQSLLDYSIPHSNFISELMSEIFFEISQVASPPTNLSPAGLQGELGYDSRIKAIIDTVITQQGMIGCLEEIAQSAGLSRAQFFRLFGRSTGMPPATFVNMIKMESCLRDLAKPDVAIQDIADDIGYFSPGNFTRFFSGQQGLSPSNYRKVMAVAR